MSKCHIPLRLTNSQIVLEPYEDVEYLFKSESSEKVNTFEILYEKSPDVFITLYRIDKNKNIIKVGKSFEKVNLTDHQIDLIKYMLMLVSANK